MKAFLLAGGLGERLRPLTLQVPKCLVTVGGVPLLEIWLRLCERHGIDHVLLNVSQHPERVDAFLRARPASGVKVDLVREPHPVGTAGTVLANRAFVDRDESFWVVYTDNLTTMALDRMLAFHRTHAGLLTMGVFRVPNPRAAGIVRLDESDRIVGFEEKPMQPASDLANAGLYLVRQPVLDLIPREPALIDFGHHVLPRLVGRMFAYRIREYYVDIGTPAALAAAQEAWPRIQAGEAAPSATRGSGSDPA